MSVYSTFNPIKVLFLRDAASFLVVDEIAFNPIKVLFLLFFLRKDLKSLRNFQSYQGSIFTHVAGPHNKPGVPFNPIKVLFLPCWSSCLESEYALSILSRFYFYRAWDDVIVEQAVLSILSRFYFYWGCSHGRGMERYLSILSRFYFYEIKTVRIYD